ncbi:MAG TPA: hypothetical protein VG347_10095 [Verrucomicrobiae bacterium]|nr:hypothetical protein [Verrucomicrobiae bacterium]
MNLTHNGKIGRLPEAIREDVNVRLHKGERGRALVAWLNQLPEVRVILAEEFGGKPIREQNLSEWRKGGHQQWLQEREREKLMDRLSASGKEDAEMDPGTVLKNMVTWVVARYVVMMKQGQESNQGMPWEQLRECCRDVQALQRGQQQNRRLDLEEEKVAFREEKVRAQLFMQLSGGRAMAAASKEEHSTPNVHHSRPKDDELEARTAAGAQVQNEKMEEIKFENCPVAPAANVETRGSEEEHDEEEEPVIRVNPGQSDLGNLKNISGLGQEASAAQEFQPVCRAAGRNYPIHIQRSRGEAAGTCKSNPEIKFCFSKFMGEKTLRGVRPPHPSLLPQGGEGTHVRLVQAQDNGERSHFNRQLLFPSQRGWKACSYVGSGVLD